MSMFRRLMNSYRILVFKEIKHRLTYEQADEDMRASIERFGNCMNKKSQSQMRWEIKICKDYWGCYPLHYFRYDLYRQDKQLSEKELIDYIPEFFFYRLFLPYYDSTKYELLIGEKNIAEQIFRSLDINQPKTLCKVINKNLYDACMNNKCFDSFRNDLDLNQYNKIFVKPVDGQGGKGIFIFNRKNKGVYKTKSGDELNEEFLNKIGNEHDYIVQLAVEQDKEISAIYTHSVNTLRIITESKFGKVKVLCAIFRVGKQGNEVDNCDRGGIAIGVNVETGETSDIGVARMGQHFYKHPDTGFVFKDYKIPKWPSIKEFTMENARKLPEFTYLGWDIALGEDGPLAIETNLHFGLDFLQLCLGGLREIFSIDNPKHYWKSTGGN